MAKKTPPEPISSLGPVLQGEVRELLLEVLDEDDVPRVLEVMAELGQLKNSNAAERTLEMELFFNALLYKYTAELDHQDARISEQVLREVERTAGRRKSVGVGPPTHSEVEGKMRVEDPLFQKALEDAAALKSVLKFLDSLRWVVVRRTELLKLASYSA